MIASLKLDFEKTETEGTIRFRLPKRDLGSSRHWGWAPLAIGIFGFVFTFHWIWSILSMALPLLKKGDWFGVMPMLFALMIIPGFYFSCMAFSFGIAILRNATWSEIRIKDQKMIDRQRFGWFSKQRTFELAKIQRLEIESNPQIFRIRDSEGEELKWSPRLPDSYGAIRVVMNDITTLPNLHFVALAYPRQLLLVLADELALAITAMRSGTLTFDAHARNLEAATPMPITVVDKPLQPQIDDENEEEKVEYEKPSNCEIEVIRQPDQPVVFSIPKRGLKGQVRSIFVVSCIWNGAMMLFSAIFIGSNERPTEFSMIAMAVGFIGLFFGVGIALLLYSLSLARRTTLIGIDDSILFVETKGIFRTTWSEFPREELDAIRVGHSGMEVNEVPIEELQILSKGKKKLGLLAQRDVMELHWLAQEIERICRSTEPDCPRE